MLVLVLPVLVLPTALRTYLPALLLVLAPALAASEEEELPSEGVEEEEEVRKLGPLLVLALLLLQEQGDRPQGPQRWCR